MSSIPSTGSAAGAPAQLREALLARCAGAILSAVGTRGATWTRVNLLAEAALAARALRCPAPRPASSCATASTPQRSTGASRDPTETAAAGGFGRLDVTSAFTPEDERVYTTSDVFAAETRLLAAHDPLVTTGR